MFDNIELTDNTLALDLQSASGFMADGIKLKNRSIEVICIESSKSLALNTIGRYRTICTDLEKIKLRQNSCDFIFGLAAFHHSNNSDLVFKKISSILKVGGYLSCSEVIIGSKQDFWLNEFVNKYTYNGHNGKFVKNGEFSQLMESNSIRVINENVEEVLWLAKDREDFLRFIHTLFGLNCSLDKLDYEIDNYLDCKNYGDKYGCVWKLLYAQGIKE